MCPGFTELYRIIWPAVDAADAGGVRKALSGFLMDFTHLVGLLGRSRLRWAEESA